MKENLVTKTIEKNTSGQNNSTNTSYRHSVSDYSPTKTSTSKSADNLPTVADLVKWVSMTEEFARFEKKYEEVEKLYRRYESAFAKIDNNLSDKIFYYQSISQHDIDTPLKTLSRACTVVTPDEFKNQKKGTDKLAWEAITGSSLMGSAMLEEALQQKPDYFDAVIKFREIVESKVKARNKSAQITSLIAGNPLLKKSSSRTKS